MKYAAFLVFFVALVVGNMMSPVLTAAAVTIGIGVILTWHQFRKSNNP